VRRAARVRGTAVSRRLTSPIAIRDRGDGGHAGLQHGMRGFMAEGRAGALAGYAARQEKRRASVAVDRGFAVHPAGQQRGGRASRGARPRRPLSGSAANPDDESRARRSAREAPAATSTPTFRFALAHWRAMTARPKVGLFAVTTRPPPSVTPHASSARRLELVDRAAFDYRPGETLHHLAVHRNVDVDPTASVSKRDARGAASPSPRSPCRRVVAATSSSERSHTS